MTQTPETAAQYPSLRNRSVFITGGGTGIGEVMVERFCAQGANVCFVDVNIPKSEALVERVAQSEGGKAVFIECDLRDIKALQAAIAEAGRINGDISVLINNAADDTRHEFEQVDEEYWNDRVNVNLRPSFFAAQAVVEQMRRCGGGSVVNMGSVSWRQKQTCMPVYTTAKAAIDGLTRTLAAKLGPDHIRVNTLVPGWVMTERQMTRWASPDIVQEVQQAQCIHKTLLPIDIANAALFLAADDSKMMTAQTLIIDAGWV
ncbi:SDR family NAD(P)-dependent oxidoreductase [Alteromonas gilva]|uniref:SDR family NAD(P)-dependent oxidoreductase n=1 Tax=Alteromonas gilva TaxID=2987522 RepID=A0ABT5KY53_9ALTE|nr:SDR family oxidoreductase [Alteromonas gilva]MDC8829700.1 SDR family NAD(P)-dependent oxidoreductase [Alteromonas gilva]